jgi:hypothetical protein
MIDQFPEFFRTFAVCTPGSFDAIVSISCVRLWTHVQTDESPLVERWFAQVSSIRSMRRHECDVKRDITLWLVRSTGASPRYRQMS